MSLQLYKRFSELVLIVGITFLCFTPLLFYNKKISSKSLIHLPLDIKNPLRTKYLVTNPKCKIPDLSPYHSETFKFWQTQKEKICPKEDPLTFTTKYDNVVTLHISDDAPTYMTCCYSNLTSNYNYNDPADDIKISDCVRFNNSVKITENFVMVHCDLDYKQYINVHSAITIKAKSRKRQQSFQKLKKDPFSVLILGIDSVSRMSFIRNLPKTSRYLGYNQWIPLNVYNAVSDTTFDSFMALLAGFNQTHSSKICNRNNKIDNCPLMWKKFEKLNYTTAYYEDENHLNTLKFKNPPIDYYYRPYIIAAESIPKKKFFTPCRNPVDERFFNLAKEFLETFVNYPTFSIFWTKKFMQNEELPELDNILRDFFQNLDKKILDRTVVFFLSNHGMNSGQIRFTNPGWLEQRLPFMYIWVPHRFRDLHPFEFENLKKKKNELTSPYDVYMTLQQILVLSELKYKIRTSKACPRCRSLFRESNPERSCEDAGITRSWCSCAGFTPKNVNNDVVQRAAHFMVWRINEIVANAADCQGFTLKTVYEASVSETFSRETKKYYLVLIETNPKAVFEGIVLYQNEEFLIQGEISRLSSHSRCVEDPFLDKYCYCREDTSPSDYFLSLL